MSAACTEVYVYFRSDPSMAGEVRAALERQRARLRQEAGCPEVRTGLRREAAPRDYLTWLEVYRFDADVPEAWLDAIERCARDCGLAALALQGRHREVFRLPG